MLKGSIKYMLTGGLLAVLLGVGSYVLIPEPAQFDEKEVSAQELDYSRSLNGVPEFNMEHYKLTSDKYLNYILLDKYSIGRVNPSTQPGWFSNVDNVKEDIDLKAKILNALGDSTALNKLKKEEEAKLKAEDEKRKAEEAKRIEQELLDKDKESLETENETENSTDVADKKAEYVKSIDTYYENAFNIDFKDVDWVKNFKTTASEFDNISNLAINYMITLKDSEDFDSKYSEHLLKVSESIDKLNKVYLDSKFNGEDDKTKQSIESLKLEIEGSLKDLKGSLE